MVPPRRLPPMKALVAFDAVGRLATVTAAAKELGVTQPALSQHIRTLEETLGTALFERRGGRLLMTEAGRAYHRTVQDAFDRIGRESEAISRRASRQVTIASNFGFSHFWLRSRLPALEAAFPGNSFRVVSADRDDAQEMRQADVTVRFAEFARLKAGERALMTSVVRPVCSPQFAQRHELRGLDGDARRLAWLPLLHMDEHDPRWLDWEGWLTARGLPPPDARPVFIYNNYPLLIAAACAGHGIALGWDGLIDDFLCDGRLVTCGPAVEQSGYGYVVATRTAAPAFREVADWIYDARRPRPDTAGAASGG